jgi:hypothetical protein
MGLREPPRDGRPRNHYPYSYTHFVRLLAMLEPIVLTICKKEFVKLSFAFAKAYNSEP